jgi:hypothetical protein
MFNGESVWDADHRNLFKYLEKKIKEGEHPISRKNTAEKSFEKAVKELKKK